MGRQQLEHRRLVRADVQRQLVWLAQRMPPRMLKVTAYGALDSALLVINHALCLISTACLQVLEVLPASHVRGEFVPNLQRLTALRSLTLRHGGLTPACIAALSSLKQLISLETDLEVSNVSDPLDLAEYGGPARSQAHATHSLSCTLHAMHRYHLTCSLLLQGCSSWAYILLPVSQTCSCRASGLPLSSSHGWHWQALESSGRKGVKGGELCMTCSIILKRLIFRWGWCQSLARPIHAKQTLWNQGVGAPV